MGLTAGSRLGPYEVVGQLGAGGMGVVYRARDTKLSREVARIAVADADVARSGHAQEDGDLDLNLRFVDVGPDGRFLVVEPAHAAATASIVVIEHWDDELKRLLPPPR